MKWVIGFGLVAIYVGGVVVAAIRTKGAIVLSWPVNIARVVDGE